MRKKIYATLVLMSFCWATFAQQRPHYAQYAQNYFLINPAIAGLESYADARLGFRKQWIGLADAPTTFYLTGHLPIGNEDFVIEPASPRFSYGRPRPEPLPYNHIGLGFSVMSDQTGPFSRLSFSMTGAYHYPINDDLQLSVGLSGGLTQHTLDFDQIKLANPQDPVVSAGKVNTLRPEFNAGVWVYSSNFYAGFSALQLLGGSLNFSRSSYDWQGKVVPNFFLTAGYRLDMGDDWEFVPSVLLKKVENLPLSADANLRVSYLNNAWLGLSYRHQDALMGWFGTRLGQKFVLSYAYEFVLNNLQTPTSGTHELMFGITLGNRNHYASPRLFW